MRGDDEGEGGGDDGAEGGGEDGGECGCKDGVHSEKRREGWFLTILARWNKSNFLARRRAMMETRIVSPTAAKISQLE